MKEPERVPVKAGGQAYGRVGKTVNLFKSKAATGDGSKNRAAAFGSKIKGKVLRHWCRENTTLSQRRYSTTLAERTRISAPSLPDAVLALPTTTFWPSRMSMS